MVKIHAVPFIFLAGCASVLSNLKLQHQPSANCIGEISVRHKMYSNSKTIKDIAVAQGYNKPRIKKNFQMSQAVENMGRADTTVTALPSCFLTGETSWHMS